MKILAVARNYADHVKELNNPMPENPVVFLKPQTALLKDNKPFYLPDFSKLMHYETEIVLKICKNGKNIDEKFALNYFDEITVGIDFTARDLQNQQKEKGLPWEIAKSFDNSAVTGEFVPITKFNDIFNLEFHLEQNGKTVQKGNTKDMTYSYQKMIAYLSKFFTLQQGDLIYTGTPFGVGAINIGDLLEGFIEGKKYFSCEVK